MEVRTEKSIRRATGTKVEAKLVHGDLSFRTLVLPPLDILTLEAARKMVDFAKAGGYVFALGELPSASADNGMNDPKMMELMAALKAAPAFTALADGLKPALEDEDTGPPGLESPFCAYGRIKFQMLQQHRRIDGKDFIWLANNTEQAQKCDLDLANSYGDTQESGLFGPVILRQADHTLP